MTMTEPSYKEMKAQIKLMEERAAQKRKEELAAVIKTMKEQIAEFDLAPQDLFKPSVLAALSGEAAPTKKSAGKPAKAKRTLPIKYRDPASGATWTGVGRAPLWFKDAADKEVFRVEAGAAPAKAAAAKPAAKKAAAAKKPAAKKAAAAPKKAKAAPAEAKEGAGG